MNVFGSQFNSRVFVVMMTFDMKGGSFTKIRIKAARLFINDLK
jgi:hypothetical protein